MKKIIVFLIFSIFITNTSSSQNKKYKRKTFKVWGNCDMCKSLIENAAESIEGVKYARWNSKKGIIKVKFLTSKTDIDKIQKAIADVGYDTENYKADDDVYNNLHYCCKYERK